MSTKPKTQSFKKKIWMAMAWNSMMGFFHMSVQAEITISSDMRTRSSVVTATDMLRAHTESLIPTVEAHRETVLEETPEGPHTELATSLLHQAQSAVFTNSDKIRMKKV